MKRQITFQVEQDLFDLIEDYAQSQDRSKSSLARISIQEKMNKIGGSGDDRRNSE